MIRGLRVHITGSAAMGCDGALLKTAHSYVQTVVADMIAQGAGLVLGVGDEPVGESGEPCLFDWTALETIRALEDPAPEWPVLRPGRFVVIASQRGLEKIPEPRSADWHTFRQRTDFHLETAPPGWRMAGIIRERQVLRGDVLLVLGGGAGAEHLAELYMEEGKPVIPIHAELGALSNDGNGGSRFLYERAISNVAHYFKLRDGAGDAAARLAGLRLLSTSDVRALASETASLIADLRPRSAFYVRLLAVDVPEFQEVEEFFREIVDPVVIDSGFTPREMGREPPNEPFMNLEIFSELHRAGLVIVDLTGTRPNCTMEMGYALARRRRIVLSAKKGTRLPFDSDKLPTFSWDNSASGAAQIKAYTDWLDLYSEMPPLVDPVHL